ncbi:MAG TPA: serine/threonine-protein kinase [Polyangiaceae bacterium]|nr:serine/threonine-protein kinase [Polyangiaceae bacterium]
MNEALAKKAKERVGQVFARKWHVDRLLDMGGMASVYAATHRNGNRVAIKLLHPTFAEHEDVKRRFLEEGYVANKVGHTGAVTVLDDDVLDDGSPFLVMELLEGESLETRLKKKTVLAPTGVLYIADKVLDVLAAAHDKDIVHRDIKPANVYLTNDGAVKVLDFGLARVRERSLKGSLTRTGMIVGTASYMPPEQARGKRDLIDARTDIWAVGATMWRAMTGRHVHEAETVQERLIAAMSQKARSIKELKPDLPAPIVDVVDRALAFQKVDRWPTAREMKAALAKAYEAVEKHPFPTAQRVAVGDLFPPSGASPSLPPLSTTSYDVAVSVVFEPAPDTQSVVVDFEDTTGKQERFELRRKGEGTVPDAPDDPTDELSDISVVELDS